MPNRSPHLRAITRLFWFFMTLGCGILPSFLLFFWIERNMAVPSPLYQKLKWPWVAFWDASLSFKIIWDLGLFFAFGFFHSLLAQAPVQRAIKTVLPVQCVRAFYLCFTGAMALALMGAWQGTGIVLWVIPGLSYFALSVLSMVIYWGLLLFALRAMSVFDPLEFLGLRQLYSRADEVDKMSSGDQLLQKGLYGIVRHPIYLFTLAAFLFAPMMSLDRMLFFAANAIYLYFAIPVEERKLEARFGQAYADYRKRVPAVIPRLRRSSRRSPAHP